MKRIKNLKSSDGFTIIELLIATAVLSIVLVMITVIMISIGNLYYKGLNQARIQDNTRAVSDDISQHLKLGDNFFQVTNGSAGAYCVGSTRYTYVLYRQIDDSPSANQTRHVLWRDANPTPGSCPAVLLNLMASTPSAGGTELIGPHSRLTAFSITGTSTYAVKVGEAYGDDDLLCDIGYPGDCTFQGVSAHMNQIIAGSTNPTSDLRCKGSVGDQFCATSILNTTAVRRLP